MTTEKSYLAPDSGPLGIYSDAAKRLSDTVQLHLAAEGFAVVGRWIAARLTDGGTDNRTYPDKATAVRFQLHETQCAYLQIPADGMGPREAEIYLAFNRKVYDAGYRMPDPSHHIHMPQDMTLRELQ